MPKAYLTTAIPYVNGRPHIGHALDYLFSDIYGRYLRLSGVQVKLQVGTDEHGNKVFQKAKELGLKTQDYVDQNAKFFQEFIQLLGVEYTDVIRTTDYDHCRRVQAIWTKLQPHIYKGSYHGWYCDGCENFVTEKEYQENHGICPDHQRPYQQLIEENYYLRLSDFKSEIKQAILSDKMQILPDFRAKEILKLLEDTPDVSVSRPKKQLSWGIPVPNDPDQVMYVWVDALSNYLTVLGYPEREITDFWPAKVQFIGKDILRFHAIIWPAILLGLKLPLPKIIHSHGHILSSGQKMSKSLGNVIDPFTVIHQYGLDAFRYYFSRHIDTFTDSDFTWEKFTSAYNNELANDYGNLVQRLATLCFKNQLKKVDFNPASDQTYQAFMAKLQFNQAISYVWQLIQNINKELDLTKPWSLAKTESLETVQSLLKSLVSQLLQANYLLKPFLPESTTKVEAIFLESEMIRPPDPLFPKH